MVPRKLGASCRVAQSIPAEQQEQQWDVHRSLGTWRSEFCVQMVKVKLSCVLWHAICHACHAMQQMPVRHV